jgi:hypothetical protein
MKSRLYREQIEIPYPVRPPQAAPEATTPTPEEAKAGASADA